MLVTRILSGMLVLALISQSAALAQESQSSAGTQLDLSSTSPILPASHLITEDQSVHISQGGSQLSIGAGDTLTPAQFVAVYQSLAGGQTLHLDVSGAAVGGTFNISPQLTSTIASLVIPQGVTGIHDFGTSSLSLAGNFTNSGIFYAISSNAATNTAQISALNITNGPGALLTSVLPADGLAGFTNLLPSLNLSLTAVQNIINYGAISSAGSLTAVAGNSIQNLIPQNGISPSMQAVNDVMMNASSIINQGNIASQIGALNLVTANLQNQALIESVMSSLSVSNLNLSSAALNVLNHDGLLRSGGALSIISANDLDISGGIIAGDAIHLNAYSGLLQVLQSDLQGPVHITAESAHVHGAGDQLNIATFNVAVDPLITNPGNMSIGNITSIEPITLIARGDITGTNSIITNLGGTAAIYIIAGVNFNVDSGNGITTVTGFSDQGGNVSGIQSVTSNADVSIAAFRGAVSGTGGNISVTNDISATGQVLIAGPGSINIGNTITTNGGSAIIQTVQPSIFAPLVFSNANGGRVSGALGASPTPGTAAAIQLGTVDTTRFIGPIANAGAINIFSRGSVSTGDLLALGNNSNGANINVVANTSSITTGAVDSSGMGAGNHDAGSISIQAAGLLQSGSIFAKGANGGQGNQITLRSNTNSINAIEINSSGGANGAGQINAFVGSGHSLNVTNLITASGGINGAPVIVQTTAPGGVLRVQTPLSLGAGTNRLDLRAPGEIRFESFINANGANVDFSSPTMTWSNGADTFDADTLNIGPGANGDLVLRSPSGGVANLNANLIFVNAVGNRNINFRQTGAGVGVLNFDSPFTAINASAGGSIGVDPGVKVTSSGTMQIAVAGPFASLINSGKIEAANQLLIGARNLVLNDQSVLRGHTVDLDGAFVNLALDIISQSGGQSNIETTGGDITIRPGATLNLNFRQSGTGGTTFFIDQSLGGKTVIANNGVMGSVNINNDVSVLSNHDVEVITPVLVMGSNAVLGGSDLDLHGGAPNAIFEIRTQPGSPAILSASSGDVSIFADPNQSVRFTSAAPGTPATLQMFGDFINTQTNGQDIIIGPAMTVEMTGNIGTQINAQNAHIRLNGKVNAPTNQLFLLANFLDLGANSAVTAGEINIIGSPFAPLTVTVPTGSISTLATLNGDIFITSSGTQNLILDMSSGGSGILRFQTTAPDKTVLQGTGVDIRPDVQLQSTSEIIVESDTFDIAMSGSIQASDRIELSTQALAPQVNPNIIINGNLSTNDLYVEAANGGNINQFAGNISATTAHFESLTGNIGTQLNPIRLPANVQLSSSTATGTSYFVNMGATQLVNINEANVFNLASAGPVTNDGFLDANNVTLITPSLVNNGAIDAINLTVQNQNDLNVNSLGTINAILVNLTSFNGSVNANFGANLFGTLTGFSGTSFQALAQELDVSTINAGTSLTLTSAGNMDLRGINQVRNGSMNLTAAGDLTLQDNSDLIASANVNVAGTNVNIGLPGGLPVKIAAGTLGANFNQFSTNPNDYDYSAVLVPGGVRINSQMGDIYIGDNVNMLSKGDSITIYSDGGIYVGSNNRMLAQAGNVTLNAAGIFQQGPMQGNIEIHNNTQITAVGRSVIPSLPFTTTEGLVMNQYVGGDIAINVDMAITNYDQFLKDNFDVNRNSAGITNIPGLGLNVIVNGGSINSPTLGGTIDVVADNIGGVTINNSNLTAAGGVIQIDPPTSTILLDGVTLSANAPDVTSGFVGAPNNNNNNNQQQPAPPPPQQTFDPTVTQTVADEPTESPSGTILPTDSVQQQAALPAPVVPNAAMETDVIVLSDDSDDQSNNNSSQTRNVSTPQNFIPVLYVGAAPCQQFLIAGKSRGDLKCVTVVASKGTVLGTVNDEAPAAETKDFSKRILSLKEGKIVVVSGQKSGLKLDVNNATLALPVGSVAVVDKKASGAMRVSMVAGGNAQVSFKGTEDNQQISAAPGEEIAFGDSEEELIAADGIDRNVITAKILLTSRLVEEENGSSLAGTTTRSNLRTQKHNLRVEKRSFNRQQMAENESLFVCLDCAQMGCSDGQCAKTKKSISKPNIKARQLNISKSEENSPFSPIAYRISLGPSAPAVPSLSTLNVTGAMLKHMGATLDAGGTSVSLSKGETLLCPDKTTIVKAGTATISADADSLVLIHNRGTSITVSNLWESGANSVKVIVDKRTYTPRAGEECIVAIGGGKAQDIVTNSPAARRNVHSFAVGSNTMAISEISLASLFLTSPVLNSLWHSSNEEDRAIAEKIAKMYAVLNIVTGRRGPYSYNGR